MKTYVSYIIQNEGGHKHKSEILSTQSPSYTFSPDPLAQQVLEWVEIRKKELKKGEEIIVTGMYKL